MRILFFVLFIIATTSCNQRGGETTSSKSDSAIACVDSMPARVVGVTDTSQIKPGKLSKEGMVCIPGGEFMMVATDDEGRPDEYPTRKVNV